MKKIILVSLSNAMGMQLYCKQLANVLSKKYDVSVIVTNYFDETDLCEEVKIYKLFYTKRPTIDKGLFILKSYFQSIKILRQDNLAIHYLNSHPANVILMLFTKHENNCFTLHDPIPHSNDLLGKCRKIIDKMIIKISKKIIVHSKYHLEIGYIKKIRYKTFYAPLASKSKNNKYLPIKHKNVFLFFGRIEDYKGIDSLILAAETLLKKRDDFKIIIAGKGNMEKYFKLIHHPDNFKIINSIIPEDKVIELFENSTFSVMPYVSASQSGVIPLSYYYSRPVIVNNLASLKEYVVSGETGIIYNNDFKELSEIFNDVLNNKYDVELMSKNSLEYGNNFLSMEIMAEMLINVYQGN